MGIKLVIILILVVFLTLVGMTGGAFLDMILPNSESVIGNGLCWTGGFVYNPVQNIGGFDLPLPQVDDVIIALFISMPILFYFFRGQSWKRLLLIFIILMVGVLVGYKLLGWGLVSWAEAEYGMEGCIDFISINGEPIIDYEWYSPLFIIGFILAGIAFIGGLVKLHRWKKGGG